MAKKSASLTGTQSFVRSPVHIKSFTETEKKSFKEIINKTHICANVSLCSSVLGPQSVNTKNYLQATSFMSSRKRDKAGTRGAVRTSSRYVYRSHQM